MKRTTRYIKNVEQSIPLVSVILPVYNMEDYLGNAIHSILEQTLDKLELIIINDGSTDQSLRVIQSFTDKRIILINHSLNIGNYPSRNKGLQIAKGKYIAVMDADDISLPERLEKQYLYLEEHRDVLAIGTQFEFISQRKNYKNPLSHEDISICLLKDNCLLHPSMMIRTDIFRKLNGYNESYKYASDYDLVCRLSLLGKIENLPDVCLKYRWHAGQISQKNRKEQLRFADLIGQKYQIEYINRYKRKEITEISIFETGYPPMGEAIGLYVTGEYEFNEDYGNKADGLLDTIYSIANQTMPVCVQNGLLGIGCGVIWLLRNGFVEGDEDEILEEIDAIVFHEIDSDQKNKKLDWIGLFYYLQKRINHASIQLNKYSISKNKSTLHLLLDKYYS